MGCTFLLLGSSFGRSWTRVLHNPGRGVGLEPPEQLHPSVSPHGSPAHPQPLLSGQSGPGPAPKRGWTPDGLSRLLIWSRGRRVKCQNEGEGGARGGPLRGGVPASLKGAHPAGPTQSIAAVCSRLAVRTRPSAAMPKCPKCDKEVYFGERTPAHSWPNRGAPNPGASWRSSLSVEAPGEPRKPSREWTLQPCKQPWICGLGPPAWDGLSVSGSPRL